MEKQKTIIVGSGIGGSAIAAMLQHSGLWQVDLYERNHFPGGRYASYDRDGFRLDVGCHLIANCDKGAMADVLRHLDCPDAVKWNYARKPSPSFNFSGQRIRFPRDLGLLGFTPEELESIMMFYANLNSIPDEDLDTCDFGDIRTYMANNKCPLLIRKVISMLCGIYFVVGDHETPLGEWVRGNKNFFINAAQGYPAGGTRAVPQAYLDCLQEHGGQVYLNTPIKRILVEDGAAVGIELQNGDVEKADIIISNVGSRQTIELIGREHFPAPVLERFDAYTYSSSVFTLKVALDASITNETMVMYLGEGFENFFDQNPDILDVPEIASHAMIPIISNLDSSSAPEGRQLLAIAGGVHGRPQDFTQEVTAQCEEAFLKVLDIVFPGFREHILWTEATTSQAIDSMFGKDGCVIGIGQKVGQVGELRPPIIDPSIRNLYHCGADTGVHGIGGELAADSALRLWKILGKI
jgi:phytoene dehydrogenase-like protein